MLTMFTSQYVLILVWIAFMGAIANRYKHTELVLGKEEIRMMRFFAYLVLIPVVFMAANRGYSGLTDTTTYLRDYYNMPSYFGGIIDYVQHVPKDKGFYFVSAVMKVIFSGDKVKYFFVFAAFQAFSVTRMFRKYSGSFMMSMFLFITSTDYISWMFNGIRQFTAVCIILFATGLAMKKCEKPLWNKYVPIILIVYFASFFHRTALLMIPLIIIAQGEAWNKKTLLFMVGVFVAVIFVGEFTDLLDDALVGTQYETVISEYQSWNDTGTNPIRVIVYSIPAIISFFGRKTIREEGGPVIRFCTNMSIMSAGLYIISMFTSGIFMGRLPIYCSLYGYILLPWEIDHLCDERHKRIMYLGLVGGYLLFYYYQMHLTWGFM